MKRKRPRNKGSFDVIGWCQASNYITFSTKDRVIRIQWTMIHLLRKGSSLLSPLRIQNRTLANEEEDSFAAQMFLTALPFANTKPNASALAVSISCKLKRAWLAKMKKAHNFRCGLCACSDRGRIRTPNPQSRNLIFYPVELRGQYLLSFMRLKAT